MPNGVYIRTEEMRKAMSKRRKGKRNPMYGKHRFGVEAPNYGKTHSKEAKRKMGRDQSGENNNMHGKHHSKATKRKISEKQKEEKHWNWKGGITSAGKKIRESNKYKQWKQQVFLADNFTCQKCRKAGGYLHAHHIKPFSKFLREIQENLPLLDLYSGAMVYSPLWITENGITLCRECHKHNPFKRKRGKGGKQNKELERA